MGYVLERAVMFVKCGWWWLGVACILAMLLSLAPISRLAINPITATVIGGTVTLQRQFPGDTLGLPRPQLSYVETVKGLSAGHDGGHVCIDAAGPFRYTAKEQVGEWGIDRWASECLDDPVGFVWEACWRWHVGAFVLSPVCISYTSFR